jgi:aspartyl-tRNA(Asn)/glutamyl-tRNA(Gln) amidotransferase subunit A
MQSLQSKVSTLLTKINKENPKLNIFLHINEDAINQARFIDKKTKKGKLYGKTIGIKANINVKGLPISCASKALEDYKGTYDATVIKKIKQEDGLILGMLNMDEFAAGNSGESSAFGPTINPANKKLIPGGSSSGSAAAIAANFCDLTLGSDTGGSIRNPASHCGVIGYKPSYGLVSRYGLCDLSMSLDQIGPLANNISDLTLLLNVIKGKDENDTTTFESKEIKLTKPKNLKIGVLKLKSVDPKIQKLIDDKVKEFSTKLNHTTSEISINHIELAVQTYYPLVYVEFFSATRRLDGRRFGKKIEDTCGPEVLRRILGGSEISKAEHAGRYYQKALQVKKLIKEEFEQAFSKVDLIISPTTNEPPRPLGQISKMTPEQIYSEDALTSPANLAEIPAISLPAGKINGIPVGLQIMAAHNEDEKLLSIAKQLTL